MSWLPFAPHADQCERWPACGRHIMACYDDETVVVYQAYRDEIGRWAAQHGAFGAGFSLDRMSWIKPNFLWMMYRSGWGTKDGQTCVLAIRIQRAAFDRILGAAVHSTYDRAVYADRDEWKRRVAGSEVRLQWDPDHGPHGGKLERRAIQLGLRGETLRSYAREWIVDLADISSMVAEQRAHVEARRLGLLQTPVERVYPIPDPDVAARLGVAG